MLNKSPKSWALLFLLTLTSITGISSLLTSQEMENKVYTLLKQLNQLPPILYGTSCIPEDEEAYNYVMTRIDQYKEEELFGPPPGNDPGDQLSRLQERLEKTLHENDGKARNETVGILCSINKGLSCTIQGDEHVCSCKRNSIVQNVEYHEHDSQCFIDPEDPCDASLQVECLEPSECYLNASSRVPPTLTPCTNINRRALNLDEAYPCFCLFTEGARLQKMLELQRLLIDLPYLSFGDPCNFETHEDLFNEGGLVISALWMDASFYRGDKYNRLREVYVRSTGNVLRGRSSFPLPKVPDPVLCDMEKSLYCNKDRPKCDCFSPAIYNEETERCLIPAKRKCSGEGDTYPYSCENGTRCIFDDVDVLCTRRNRKDILAHDLIISNNCTCQSSKFKLFFDYKTVDEWKIKTKVAVAKTVHDLNNTAWTVVEFGQSCNWRDDRTYFEMQDFIFAGKEHIYINMKNHLNLSVLSDTKGFKRIPVCDLTKGMRCGFISSKCECPILQYSANVITSELNPEKRSCELHSDSPCHSTLSEWLPCEDNYACIYDAVPVLCNRKNKQVAIKKRLRLPTADCTCKPKELARDEFSEENFRSYSLNFVHDEL